jgi:hypothetical protein
MAPQSVTRSESIAPFVPDLELLIAEAMAEWKIPGLAIAVVQNGELALVRGYGLRDVEASLTVTIDTQFMICSITKSHLHGLGPFGGRAPPRLEEASAGLRPGIPAVRRRCDRPHYRARFALPSFRATPPRLGSYAGRSVTRPNAGGNALSGAKRRRSQHLPVPEPRSSRRGYGGRTRQRSELIRIHPRSIDRQAAHECDIRGEGSRRGRRCRRALRDGGDTR